MKKIFTLFLTSVVMLVNLVPVTHAFSGQGKGEQRQLLVTAYYSPLPDQRFYIRGSYTADIRLNGRGTNGADGTQVYEGMLAAPKTYPFGTRVYIPGLGVGEVHDRGGAILAHKSYDRIDVWMGRGEEGLARALNWGARLIDGEVFWDSENARPSLTYMGIKSTLADSVVNRLTQRTQLVNAPVLNKTVTPATTPEDIKDLQISLTGLGFYGGFIDGVMNDTIRESIIAFQLEENIIEAKGDQGAGIFGPTTRKALKNKLTTYNAEREKDIERIQEQQVLLTAGLGKNADGEQVAALQRMLWELGYYHGSIHQNYDSATIDAVFAFQIDRGVLGSAWDVGAGYYGNLTHKALVAAVGGRIEKIKEYPRQSRSWIPAKPFLPFLNDLTVSSLEPVSTLSFDIEYLNTKIVQTDSSQFTAELDLYDQNDAVTRLQNILIARGHLEAGLNTGYFGQKTKAALIEFQIEKGLIASANEQGAGRVGPKTKAMLNKA